MKKEKELLKNTLILSVGKLLPKIIAIITLPIVTAQLTKEEYGTYDFISTLIMLLLPIATLQVQSSAFRFLIDCRKDEKKSGEIITNIFAITIPISVIVSVLMVILWQNISIFTKVIVAIYFCVDIGYIAIAQATRGLSYNKFFSISSIIISLVNCIGIILLLKIKNYGLNGIILSLITANLAAIIYLSIKIKIWKYINFSYINKHTIKELISYSWPMIPNNLSNWVLKLSDRIVITYFLGIKANAIYAVANKIPNLLSIAQSIFVMAWQENATIALKDKDAEQYYSKMFSKIFDIMFTCTALLIGITPIIFKILIRGDYSEAYYQMPILILAMFFFSMSSFFGGIYVAHKKTKSIGITTIFAAICNLALNLLLVKMIGITASSISTLIAYFVLYIYRMIDIKKFQKMKYSIKKQVIDLIIIITMLIVCFVNNFYTNAINLIFAIVLFISINKELIKSVVKKTCQKLTKGLAHQ